MSNHFWDWDRIHAARSMRDQGQTWAQIGARFGRPAAEVMVKLENVARGNLDYIAWNDADDAIVRAHHHQGLDAVVAALAAADRPRASRQAVYQRFRTLGLVPPRRVGRKPRPAGGPRNHTGHRVGERHHNARHSDAVVRQARALHEQGLGYKRIGQKLDVPWRTVADWCRYSIRGSA